MSGDAVSRGLTMELWGLTGIRVEEGRSFDDVGNEIGTEVGPGEAICSFRQCSNFRWGVFETD
jgi:hypothetical protein